MELQFSTSTPWNYTYRQGTWSLLVLIFPRLYSLLHMTLLVTVRSNLDLLVEWFPVILMRWQFSFVVCFVVQFVGFRKSIHLNFNYQDQRFHFGSVVVYFYGCRVLPISHHGTHQHQLSVPAVIWTRAVTTYTVNVCVCVCVHQGHQPRQRQKHFVDNINLLINSSFEQILFWCLAADKRLTFSHRLYLANLLNGRVNNLTLFVIVGGRNRSMLPNPLTLQHFTKLFQICALAMPGHLVSILYSCKTVLSRFNENCLTVVAHSSNPQPSH